MCRDVLTRYMRSFWWTYRLTADEIARGVKANLTGNRT